MGIAPNRHGAKLALFAIRQTLSAEGREERKNEYKDTFIRIDSILLRVRL